MQGETIFRFYHTRPAIPKKSDAITLDPYQFTSKKTDLLKLFDEKPLDQKKLHDRCQQIIRDFKGSDQLIIDKITGIDLLNWFNDNRNKSVEEAKELIHSLKSSKNEKEHQIPEQVTTAILYLADVAGAFVYTGTKSSTDQKNIIYLIKLLYIIYISVDKPNRKLEQYVSSIIVTLPIVFFEAKTIKQVQKNKVLKSPIKIDLKKHVKQLEKLYCEVFDFASNSGDGYITQGGSDVKKKTGTLTSQSKSVVSDKISDRLDKPSKDLLSELGVDFQNLSSKELVSEVEGLLNITWESTGYGGLSKKMINLGGIWIDKNQFQNLVLDNEDPTNVNFISNSIFKVTVGELLLVKQKLKGYQLSEIAHVENVLSGEKRNRNHRRLNRLTTDFFVQEEKEQTTERDLATTDRNELQTEMNRIASTELGIDLGVQVSGSYGPAVSFESQLDSHFSSSVEESQRKATTFLKEITEKSSEKIRELVRKERRTTQMEEVEEINVHAFENNNNEPITGVYRWLDKVYEAQIFSYGQRLMLDFVLPEPALFYLESLVQNEELLIEKPELPKFGNLPLSPSNLTKCNYMKYIRAYGVIGAEEPPPEKITVSYFDKQEGKTKADYARSAKIQLPDFYAASSASIGSFVVTGIDNSFQANILIGDVMVNVAGSNGWQHIIFPRKREKELALALHYNDIHNFSAAIDVFCTITNEGIASWQNKVYEAVMEAYQRKLDEYNEIIATASREKRKENYTANYSNTSGNKNCCTDELRKLAIMVLSNNSMPDLNLYHSTNPSTINIEALSLNSTTIRFFESAFEWNNLSYVMYPYYWGKKARWASALQIHAEETEFTRFLKAGAARLQVSVRPGFERAVSYYLQTGQIWEGDDTVIGSDEINLPIIQEITEGLGIQGDLIPYPQDATPWEISIPTNLIYLQKDVPELKDILAINS